MVAEEAPAIFDSDEDAPIGPGAEEEAFIESEEAVSRPATVAPPRGPDVEAPPAGRIDDLVERIPAETRDALHDLLRARFTRVRRLREGELR